MSNPEERLRRFQTENNIVTKGPLSLVIQFTRMVSNKDFPLNPDDYQTSSKGQVAGLGGGNLRKILGGHGISQILSSEGGRTSRGSMVHCTTAPGAPLIEKCKANLREACHPIIITVFDRVRTALDLASDAGIGGRVEVWDIQQFLSSNVYERSSFDEARRNSTLADIVSKYNEIVLEKESDPSLRIRFDAN